MPIRNELVIFHICRKTSSFIIKLIPCIFLERKFIGSVSYMAIKATAIINITIQKISKKKFDIKSHSFFNALSISCKTIILLLKVHLTYKALTTRSSLRNGRSVDVPLDKTPSTIDTSLLLNMIFRMYIIVAAKLNLYRRLSFCFQYAITCYSKINL